MPALAAGSGESRELSLKDAVELATKMNPRLQIANLRVLESQGVFERVRSGYLPQIGVQALALSQTANLGSSAGLQFPGIPRRIGPFENFDARPVFEQTLFNLSLYRRIEAARDRIRQSRWDARSLREATALAVIQVYLAALEADSRRDAAAARLDTASTLLQQTRDYLEAGAASRLDYTRAEVVFQRETAALAAAKQEAATSRYLLQQTIGVPVDGEIRLSARFELSEHRPPSAEEALAGALETRPEVLTLRAKLAAAGNDLRAARAQRLPAVGFQADYGVSGEAVTRGVSTWSYGARLSLPVFQGGRIGAEIKEVESRRRQAEEELREMNLRIQAEVRTAIAQLEAAWIAAEAAEKASAAARESLDLAQARFGAGLTTNLDVVQAQESLAVAENFEFESLYRYHLARANLARAVGDVAGFL